MKSQVNFTQPAPGILLPIMFMLALYSRYWFGDVIAAALMLSVTLSASAYIFGSQLARAKFPGVDNLVPKLIVDNFGKNKSPFVDATGAKAGALLGDVKHDPFQSGGLGTPAHLRVAAGMIHKAHKGVLFIDEISSLSLRDQQELLTALQEKRYAITGQSPNSSGSMVITEPAPCDFVLVAAGNMEDLKHMHPALRSIIRGYGYEVYMDEFIDDTPENHEKLYQFVAQEVKKDGKIPHFSGDAVELLINEARKMAGRKGKLTLRLRELGGLVRAAGDIAIEENSQLVQPEHIIKAKQYSRTLESQISEKLVEQRKEYRIIQNTGSKVGRVNGLAVLGDSGIVLPIEAAIAPASSSNESKIIATGKLGEIAKEAVLNVSAIIKRIGEDKIKDKDIHIQFLQTYSGVEGDSASISVASAIFSVFSNIPLRQDVAMTGSLSVLGEVLPVGGVSAKVEAAVEAGIKTVLIPQMNKSDVILDPKLKRKVKIIPVSNIYDVLKHALVDCEDKDRLLENVRSVIT